jgi:hypothetical protein
VKLSKGISWLLRGLQRVLFPQLEECWQGPLTDKERQLVAILELVRIEEFVLHREHRLGRPAHDREAIARSFVAKAVYGYPTTRSLIEALNTAPNLRRICGFQKLSDVPHESKY